jgi:dipeptidase E
MKLFLCSDKITKSLKPSFETFVEKPITEFKKIVFITTGANPTPPEKQADLRKWLIEDRKDLDMFSNADITELDIANIQGDELRSLLEQQDLIYMNGGYTEYLMQQVHKSGLSEYLFELLDSGIIYVGSSTGSMIMSEQFSTAEFYPGEEEPGASKTKGFGLLDFELFPHYDEKAHLPHILKHRDPNISYCLFKNGQAISYENGKITMHEGNGGKFEFLQKDIN